MADIIIPEELYDAEEDQRTKQFEHFRFVADKGQTVLRLDKFLVDRVQDISRNRIQSAAAAGAIIVNGVAEKVNYKVKPDDVISIMLAHPPKKWEIIPEDIPLTVVYEDGALLVVNKPAGMVVHPAHGNHDGTLLNALAYYLRNDPNFDANNPSVGLVHRIDKDTSGLLVVAKSESAKAKLGIQFMNKTTRRLYHALVWGNPKQEEGTVEGNIGRCLKDRQRWDVFPEGDYGKPSVTHYRVLQRFSYVTLVECRLETGRTHQIRVHMKYIGHPLFNDEKYGGNEILKGTRSSKYKQFVQNCFEICPRQALHAKTLGFVHPVSDEELYFDSELPADMQQLLDKWEVYKK